MSKKKKRHNQANVAGDNKIDNKFDKNINETEAKTDAKDDKNHNMKEAKADAKDDKNHNMKEAKADNYKATLSLKKKPDIHHIMVLVLSFIL
ncbi:MAG: hypothetical protein K6G11_10445, partial [Lachnospiraceae bacterium]|nr:hypothetical protein [Lachnospiraceae bacterium]